MENRPWFVVRVRRIFLDGPVYGERSVFCSFRAVAHQWGEEDHGHKHGHGHGHHEKDAHRDTNNTPPVCCCELIAPLNCALRGHLNLFLVLLIMRRAGAAAHY